MLGKLVALLLYGALAVVLLAFIFSNRAATELSLFPLTFSLVMPLYVALSAVFLLGLLLGIVHSVSIAMRFRRRAMRDARLIRQLERELSMKAETHPQIGRS